jgi:hypothetical protein
MQKVLWKSTGTVTRGLNEAAKEYSAWEMKLYKRVTPFYEGYKTIILSLLAVALLSFISIPATAAYGSRPSWSWSHPGNLCAAYEVGRIRNPHGGNYRFLSGR